VIDWSAPDWPEKFSQDAWRSLLGWLEHFLAGGGPPSNRMNWASQFLAKPM